MKMRKGMVGLCLVLGFLRMLLPACAEGRLEKTPLLGGEIVRVFESDSLDFVIERFEYDKATCYFTRIWMQDPAKQIEKGTARWRKDLMYPSEQAKKLPVKPMIVINGSGFICKQYPWIPEDYPGKNSDYFNTPLGSLTITNGEIMRNLEGVKYYGLTLEADGLHMYVDEDNETVLSHEPMQTWSFYDGSPLVLGKENLVDHEWQFANERNIRTIIGRMEDDTVMLLIVTDRTSLGLTLVECADFLIEQVHPLWAYNLDGGPSTAFLVRPDRNGTLKTIFGNRVKDTDIMGFCELPSEGE